MLASHAQNKQPEAEELYQKALALKAEDATYTNNLAELYRQQVGTRTRGRSSSSCLSSPTTAAYPASSHVNVTRT